MPYVIGGSLASSMQGIPRATQDVDVIAELAPEHADRLVETLAPEFYVAGVLEVQGGSLDDAYLQRWASHLGVADLAKARKGKS